MTINLRKLALFFLLAVSATAHATIIGRVIDADADPVAGAAVRVYAAEDSAVMRARLVAGKDRMPVASTQTGASGSFSIEVTGQPAVDITVETEDFRWTVAAVDGEDLGAITLGLHSVQNLRVTSEGKPVAGAVVLVGTTVWRSDAAGAVSTFLGPYSVVHPDYAIANIESPGAREIKLTHGIAVRGRVVNAGGPVAHAIVSIDGWPLAESAGDGTFAIAHAPENWRSISAVRGNETGASARAEAGSVEIRMQPGAAFTGTVRDAARGAAVAGARMTIIGQDGTWKVVVSDVKGSFTIAPLLAQKYQVVGLHPAYAIESAGVAVPDPGGRNFTAQPFTRVRGRVLGDDHKPMAGVIVYANNPYARAAITNAAGEFTLRFASSSAPAVISTSKPGYLSGVSNARIWPPGDVREDVVLTLGQSFLVRVRVVDQQGRPVENAEVGGMRLGNGVRSIVPCYSETRQDCHHAGPDGIVTLIMMEGLHDLAVVGDDIAPVRLSKQMITARSPEMVVKVDRGIEIRGRVVHPDGTPAAGSVVESPMMASPRTAVAAGDGTFRLRGVPAGPGSVQAFSADRQLFSTAVKVNTPASDVTITMPRGVRLQGRVVDRATQKPVNDFTILLPPSNSVSDGRPHSGGQRMHAEDGRYTLENVSPGTLDILIRAAGYSEGSRTGIAAEDGKTISGVDVQLDRAARLTGRVTSASKPVAGVLVLLDGNPFKPNAFKALTDAEGVYAIEGVPEGEHSVRFEKFGFVPSNKHLSIPDAREVPLDVVLDTGHELRGRVIDSTGRGVPEVSVSAGSGSAQTDEEGAFVVRGLAQGQYQVRIHKSGFLTAAIKVDLPQTQPLTFTLDSGATVRGRVTGVPPEQFSRVTVFGDADHSRTPGEVDAQGNFAIPGMPEGPVRVEASLASRQAPSKTVVVQNGVAPLIEMNFAEGIAISGRVSRNGSAPPPNANIAFYPSPVSNDPGRRAQIAPDGSYEVSGLRAGEYNVQITATGFGYKTKYTATASGRFDIEMHTTLLRGRVIDSISGAPVAKTHILVSDAEGQPPETDSEGRFSIDGLTDGSHSLDANRPGYLPAHQRLVLSNGAVPDVELRLEPMSATVIHVVDAATGAPVGADISIFSNTERALSFPVMPAGGGASKVWVKPGSYKISVHAEGYPSKMVDVTISTAEVTVTIAH